LYRFQKEAASFWVFGGLLMGFCWAFREHRQIGGREKKITARRAGRQVGLTDLDTRKKIEKTSKIPFQRIPVTWN
jgi:hypothetical protein